MKVAVFNTKPYDREFLEKANAEHQHQLKFLEPHLTPETASLAQGFDAVCVFVNDELDAPTLERLHQLNCRYVALRCAGFNNVDLAAAQRLGIRVVRVPAYSPNAVAEYTVGLILTLNRHLHRAYNRVREGNFSLNGLMGFDLCGRTVGVVGTGAIGVLVAKILSGFSCRVLAYDVRPNSACEAFGVKYVDLAELWREADIITLNCPLTPDTRHLINERTIAQMRRGVMIINTSRGAVVDTAAVVAALKTGQIGYLGLDVYEEESDYFFEDSSNQVLADDVLARLLTFPNVIVTGHQAFFTRDALSNIAKTTLRNLAELEQQGQCANQVGGK